MASEAVLLYVRESVPLIETELIGRGGSSPATSGDIDDVYDSAVS